MDSCLPTPTLGGSRSPSRHHRLTAPAIHLAHKAGGGCSVILVVWGPCPSPPYGTVAVRRPCFLGRSFSGAGAVVLILGLAWSVVVARYVACRCRCRCRSSSPARSYGGVVVVVLASFASSLGSCRLFVVVPRPPSLSSVVPRPRCPCPVGRRLAIHPASRWHRGGVRRLGVGCVVSGPSLRT
jgi:hypothetical protein